jgi:hydrogenase expression/formation protein HypE
MAAGRLMNDLISPFKSTYPIRVVAWGARCSARKRKIALTTDTSCRTPFLQGRHRRLAGCGTVNDLLMRGSTPRYLSAGFVLEEGLEIETLERAVVSMRRAADEAGVEIVAGDTKVIKGKGGMFINTSGIGMLDTPVDISAHNAADGDAVLISGLLGDHHACILSSRMGIENSIRSDCAPLIAMVRALILSGLHVHVLRDVTRGGLASVLHEIAACSQVEIELFPSIALASAKVQGFCDILGLDPLYMGNEGKLALILPQTEAEQALNILRSCRYGGDAQIIGAVRAAESPAVLQRTRAGSTRLIEPLLGEGLPRIC